jgi:uncharacterized sulfatase
MPTVCAAAGAELPDDRVYDGRDMLPAILGRTKEPLHEALFWYDGTDQWAVRIGKWKLLSRRGSLELYDLTSDISETDNLAGQNRDIVARLRQTFEAWKGKLAPSISKPKRDRKPAGTDAARRRNSKDR